MNIEYQKIKKVVVVYAAIPVAIFFVGWLNWISAVLFTLLLSVLLFFLFRSAKSDECEHKCVSLSKRQLLLLAVIALTWCIFAGQGGFIHQSSDHVIRNRIFFDMIVESWPVTYNDDRYMLCYYISQWTLPAVIGKGVFSLAGTQSAGWIAGNIALLIWSSVGVFLTLLLITLITNTGKKIRPVFSAMLFIFFSGLDMIMPMINGSVTADHLEWWAEYFQYSSNTTCLFWVYNQTIVVWLVVLCIINESSFKNFAAVGILAFPYGPFPFVGIIMLCVIKAVFLAIPQIRRREIRKIFSDIFSPQNCIGVLAIAPVYVLYYTANIVVSNTVTTAAGDKVESGFRFHSALTGFIRSGDSVEILNFVFKYLLFVLLEFGIYTVILIIANRKKQDGILIGSAAALLIIPLIQMGTAYDFSMRVSIPLLLYICVSLMRLINRELPEGLEFNSLGEFAKKKSLLIVTMLVFVLGAFNPANEFRREITQTFQYGNTYRTTVESLETYNYKFNFAADGYKESRFYKIMGK